MPETELVQNWIFAAMPDADQAALRPHMKKVFLPTGDDLNQKGQRVGIVFFPVTAELANMVRSSDGRSTASAMVGRNGVTALTAALADAPIGWDVHVTIAGYAWSVDASILRSQHKASPSLAETLLQHTYDNEIAAAQSALCSAYHPNSQRLASWLLSTQDRTSLQELSVTQDELGILLGAQRTTVVQSCNDLKAGGSISQARGKIKILDRSILRSQACCCYGATVQH